MCRVSHFGTHGRVAADPYGPSVRGARRYPWTQPWTGPPRRSPTKDWPRALSRPRAARLRASWRRSEQYGVPPDEVQPVFTDSLDTSSLLYECATEVLTGLQATIANESVS